MKKFKLQKFTCVLLLLIFNSCSEDDLQISNQQKVEAISKDLDANIQINSNVTKENSIVFESEKDYRDFIIEMQKQEVDNKEIILEQINDNQQTAKAECSGVFRGSGGTSGFATLTYNVSVLNGCITGIDGGFTGITLGVSYTNGGSSFGCKSGTICGTKNYNLVFEGIGTVYSQRVCHTIRINC